jgi:5-methylcytosine-specific restriction protein A
MKWKDFVYQQVVEHCNAVGSRTFSLQDILKARLELFKSFRPDNNHVEAKIRQQLQFLRDDNLISFLDNTGHYTLRGIDLLDEEAKETVLIDLTKEAPEKKEYLVETYVRNVKWAKRAKELLGYNCLFYNCGNTFLREDGTPYIEVHHIIPLCHGGEGGIWNLSVLCAHHHRMAHFADVKTRITVENFLLKEITARI